jgi:myo-inositol-1(or 4)-monophosphatase
VDGYWDEPLAPWDMAAGILMVREAGGFVSDKNGQQDMYEQKNIVAGNEVIQGQLLRTLKKPV